MEDRHRLCLSREYKGIALNKAVTEKDLKGQEVGNLQADITETINSLTRRVELLEQVVFREQVSAPTTTSTGDSDFSELTYLKKLGSTLDKCLAILDSTFRRHPNHPGLTPDEMETILREQFGEPIPLTTISPSLLRATGIYVTRTKVKGSPVRYRYRILPKGQERIRQKTEELTPKHE
jgi:hypothetical protein